MGVGIDIGSESIKITEVEKNGEKYSLKAFGIVGYKGKSVNNMTDEKEFAGIAQILMKLKNEAKVKSDDVAVALPEALVSTSKIDFPNLTDQEIASAVKWEAEQHIPFPIDEAIVQHEIIERDNSVSPPKVSVLLVAAARNLVQKYVRIIELAKMAPIYVETELIALARSLAPTEGVSLVMDMGASSTDMALCKNGVVVFSRSIPTAGQAFTRSVAQGLGIQIAQAEQYKRAYGFSTNQLEGKIKAALDPVFMSIVDEVKKAVRFYQTEQSGSAPSSIIVSGGTAGLPHIIPYLSKSLGMEVLIANPFGKVDVKEEDKKQVAPYSPLYAVSLGLAMR